MAVDFRHVVIGAGVVGLSIASRLCQYGPTAILERNVRIGEETSSRNSEVIHAGLYYPEDSLKTALCIRGRHLLYELAERVGIPHKKVGKWIIAQTEEEDEFLQQLKVKADRLGVPTRFLSKQEVREGEPLLRVAGRALESSSTGIVDSHAFMHYLHKTIDDQEGAVALHTDVKEIEKGGSGGSAVWQIRLEDDSVVTCNALINCAGLHSDRIARLAMKSLFPDNYTLHYVKGCYYGVRGRPLVSRLTYPVPPKNLVGLGVHTTLDLAGRMRLGPDAHYVDTIDYQVNEDSLDGIYQAAVRYLPSLQRDSLFADYAGIRPKLNAPGQPARDFVVEEESARGLSGLVNCVGIESPGLTSSLAIAERVATLLNYH